MTLLGSHATRAVSARNERGNNVKRAWILQGKCVWFARNVILFLFEHEREG